MVGLGTLWVASVEQGGGTVSGMVVVSLFPFVGRELC